MNTLSRRLNNISLKYGAFLCDSGAMDRTHVSQVLEDMCNEVVGALTYEATDVEKESAEARVKVMDLPEDHSFEWTYHKIIGEGARLGSVYSVTRLTAIYEAKMKELLDGLEYTVEALETMATDADLDVVAVAEDTANLYRPLVQRYKTQGAEKSTESNDVCPYINEHKDGESCPVCGKE